MQLPKDNKMAANKIKIKTWFGIKSIIKPAQMKLMPINKSILLSAICTPFYFKFDSTHKNFPECTVTMPSLPKKELLER